MVRRQDERWGEDPRGGLHAAARSTEAVQAVLAWRQGRRGSRPQEHLRDDGQRRAHGCWRGSGGSLDRLLGLVDLDGGERLLAELAQDVVGAAAELARDRETGTVVVDPLAHLAEVGVVGGGRRAADWAASNNVQRSSCGPSCERWPGARL